MPAISTGRAALALFVLAGAAMPATAAVPADPYDFVVQQVCVDGAGRALPDDPAACSRKRLLRVGEAVPFLRVDAGHWQALYSYPVTGLGGERRAVATKVFGGADTSGSFGDLGVRSGYDLLEVSRRYVSGIRTSDPGGGDQIFWRTADCVRTDGWIFFPPGLQPGERGETKSTLKITPGPSTACPALRNIAPDFTAWERPTEPYRYTSGKSLDTIQSMHFAYGDPADPAHDNDSMEKFFFTREYGFSRWEAWQTEAGCRKRVQGEGRDPAEHCRPSPQDICNGPNVATFYGKQYLRLDCRDSTFAFKPDPNGFNPLTSAAAPGDIVSRNLLRNGTFFEGRDGWATAGDLQAEPTHLGGNDAALRLTGSAGSLGQSFEVPADLQGAGRVLRWGVTLGTAGRPAPARLVLTLTRPGAPPLVIDRPVEADGRADAIAITTPLPDGGGAPLAGRIELRLDAPADVTLDDTFAAVLERPSAGR